MAFGEPLRPSKLRPLSEETRIERLREREGEKKEGEGDGEVAEAPSGWPK